MIPQLIHRVHQKEDPFIVYGSEQSRSFCYIEDAVRCLEEIMNNESCSGKILNLGTDTETNIEDLVKLIFEVCEYTPDIEHADPVNGTWSTTATMK